MHNCALGTALPTHSRLALLQSLETQTLADMLAIHSRHLLCQAIQVPLAGTAEEAPGDAAPDPGRPLLNARKQFMLLHKRLIIKGTCSTENFQYGLKP
jgi:hypothetical protein